jgi:hypothetical protein
VAEPPPAAYDAGFAAEPPAEDAYPEDDIEATPLEAAEPEPPQVRASARGVKRPVRAEGRSSALIWAGAAAFAAAIIAGAIVFREQIVRLCPKSSSAYAGLGLAVGGGGLVIEQVRVQPAFLAGRPVLSVYGAIRNVHDVQVRAPPVRLTLLNRAGQPVAAKIARPLDATIPPHGERHFIITMLDPPATARDLEVRFETAGAGRSAPPAAAATLAPSPPPVPAPETVPAPEAAAPPVAAAPAAPSAAIAPPRPAVGGQERG